MRISHLFAAIAASVLTVSAANAQVVISELYTGGGAGTVGTTFARDYIELFNNGVTDVSLVGFSVQYASAAGIFSATNQLTLTGTIFAKSFYLLEVGAVGTVGGSSSVAPNQSSATNVLSLSNTGGKVALASNTTPVTFAVGANTPGTLSANVVDFVGYGTGNAFEGTAAAPIAANTTSSIIRNSTGTGSTLTFTDTNGNNVDFTTGAPNLQAGIVPEAGTLGLLAFALPIVGGVIAARRRK